MSTPVSNSFRIIVLRAYVKQLIKGIDNIRWELDHDIICLAKHDRLTAEMKTELDAAKAELKQLELDNDTMSLNIKRGNFREEKRFRLRRNVGNVIIQNQKLNVSTDLHGSLIIEGKGGNYYMVPADALLKLI